MTSQEAAPETNDVYATFCGVIDQGAVQRILGGVALATQQVPAVTRLHVLFQSTGGSVSDGVCLYNFFRNAPLPITLYNTGGVSSAAAIAYLGAEGRQASAQALFMLHRTTTTTQSAPASTLEALAESATLNDQRTEAILRQHLSLSDAQWKALDRHDAGLSLSGEEAVRVGLSTGIGDFSPPKGKPIYNLYG